MALLVALSFLAPQIATAREPFNLDAVRAQVRKDYGSVAHLSANALVNIMRKEEEFLLIDVRGENEFEVSRIAGAERVDPRIWRNSFMARFGDHVRGKMVVFYCSVGVRSSRLAANVQEALIEQGAKEVFNLDGGVFAWHNENRTLENARGATDYVHPFDAHWGKLVRRQELLKSVP
jgi:rhodanese-related sulfurtransferase